MSKYTYYSPCIYCKKEAKIRSISLLHKFTFNGEQVTFSGRMIETANFNKSVSKGEMVPTITLAQVQPNDW